MARFRKIYIREIRDELGFFPNWPVEYPLELGLVGFYDGRDASFHWKTSLAELGIAVQNVPESQAYIDEFYGTEGRVSIRFGFDQKLTRSKAGVLFKKKRAISAQSFELRQQKLPLDQLERRLVEGVVEERVRWDRNYVILTDLFRATGFTVLISGSSTSRMEIACSQSIGSSPFNIANLNLGLDVSASREMAYSAVAKAQITPFLRVQKLICDPTRDRYYLRRYPSQLFMRPTPVR